MVLLNVLEYDISSSSARNSECTQNRESRPENEYPQRRRGVKMAFLIILEYQNTTLAAARLATQNIELRMSTRKQVYLAANENPMTIFNKETQPPTCTPGYGHNIR